MRGAGPVRRYPAGVSDAGGTSNTQGDANRASDTPAPARRRKLPWGKIIQTLVSVIVVVAIFGFAIPKFADYEEVGQILRDLTGQQIAYLLLAEALNMATYWLVYVASLPGLRFWQAGVEVQTNSSIAGVLPAGGAFAVGITYSILGSWGFSAAKVTEAIAVSGIWNIGIKLVMPVAAVLGLLAIGESSHGLVIGALIGVAAVLVAGALIGLVLWKESLARSIGAFGNRAASWMLRPIHKGPVTGLDEQVVAFRSEVVTVASRRWLLLTITAILSQAGSFLVFYLSMRFVGIGASQVNFIEIFTAYAFGQLVGTVPITPSGLGTADAVYIALMAAAGASSNAATAGDLLFRTLTWAIPIPIGAMTYVIWRVNKRWRVPVAADVQEPASA